MAINLDFSNDAIAAYSRGAQERALQEERLREAADKQVELKQRQQQLDQTAKLEQQRIDNEHDYQNKVVELSKATHKLALNDAINKAQLQQSETGQTPAGFMATYVPNAQDPTKSDVQQYVDPTNPAARFQPIDPAVMAQRTQQQLVPKTDETIRQQKALQDAEQVKALAVAEENGAIRERIRAEQDAANTKIQNNHDRTRLQAAGIVANRAKKDAISASGLSRISGELSSDKDLERASQLAINVADAARIDPKTDNAENDNRLIYAAARLVNPGIGVRNFESKDIRDAAQSAADTLGIKVDNFFNLHQRLTTEARQKLKDFIIQGSQATFDAADQKYANYQSRVKAVAPDLPQSQIDALLGTPAHQRLLKDAGYKRQDNSSTSSLPEVTTKAQFDALPKGAKYTENGHPFIKP